MKAPFPWFGGKRDIASEIWARFGRPKQYIEPFCGSAAVLLAAPAPAPLEVIGDVNGFVANFVAAYEADGWRIAGASTFNEGLGIEVLMVRDIEGGGTT